jgi:hypothetical protein
MCIVSSEVVEDDWVVFGQTILSVALHMSSSADLTSQMAMIPDLVPILLFGEELFGCEWLLTDVAYFALQYLNTASFVKIFGLGYFS